MLPTIDATKVVGLISLPGAMTGLILAGVDPLTAIRYQIVVMYMLLAAWALGSLVTTRAAQRALFDEAHRLRPLAAAGGGRSLSSRLARRDGRRHARQRASRLPDAFSRPTCGASSGRPRRQGRG